MVTDSVWGQSSLTLPDVESIFRVEVSLEMEGLDPIHSETVSPSVGPTVQEEVTEVTGFGRMIRVGTTEVSPTQENFQSEGLVFVDPGVAQLFEWEYIAGDPETALAKPLQMVITEAIALKYFDGVECLGQTLNLPTEISYTISGVIKDLPKGLPIAEELFASYATYPVRSNSQMIEGTVETYLQVPVGTSAVTAYLDRVVEKELRGGYVEALGLSMEEWKAGDNRLVLELVPVAELAKGKE
ncbi:MAG TPA: hypothetical protein DCR93_38260 [Cytophagales bacterium]|nr:hypothetical protein [Cytophagales bacterium]